MGSIAGSTAGIWQQVDASGLASNNSSNASSAAGGSNNLSSPSAFLQLLVAQLKNQDPTQPVDPTTFVTQLAEYNDVEENLGTRQDLDAISEKFLGVQTPPSESGGSGATAANASDVNFSGTAQTAGSTGSASSQ
jgi:flagellar basal-body rod modification protein FlgD